MRVSPIELMTVNDNQQSYNCLYEQQRASLQANQLGNRKAHIFASFMPSTRRKPSDKATEQLKSSQQRIINQIPQAKSISPFLASTTKLRGGRFPLIGQGKLCVSGDFPHSNG